jgi:nitrile hydratase beta subunit
MRWRDDRQDVGFGLPAFRWSEAMNGAQDLGGMMGFGRIAFEPDEPWFHAAWERRAFGLTLAMGGTGSWTIDESRHARESLPPAEYLSSSYYEIWTKGVERLVVLKGLVSEEELRVGQALTPPAPVRRVVRAEDVPAMLARGGPAARETERPARFAVGDRVRTRNMHPQGHTRLPRYARDKEGIIERVHGAHVFPDSNAHGQGENPQWLYTVRFTGPELWGEEADPALLVSIDAWESYLEPA